ncbi:alpha beta hydrolase fold-3 domain protein [Stagonosporopsis vannaccii]|nr:alpha beta hydrolase fold-3 domain protein [Stagonosporopsis vannaccii]
MPLSRHPALPYLSTLFGAIFLFFGGTYMLSPRTGYSLYGFSTWPSNAVDWAVMERVMVLYGAKDLFIGAAILSSTWAGTRRSAGLVTLAAAACAGVDGWVVKQEAGTGEWNHWGYGGVMGLVGLVMAGLLG